jgi:hypothetical protein
MLFQVVEWYYEQMVCFESAEESKLSNFKYQVYVKLKFLPMLLCCD